MATRSPFGVLMPADFADLGPRDALDQALHRLVRAGTIRSLANQPTLILGRLLMRWLVAIQHR